MMQKLIDAYELEREMFRRCIDTNEEINKGRAKWDSGLWIRYKVFEDAITLAQRVDAVEVVRCKDCKHKPTGSGVNHDINFPKQDYRCPCRCEDYWYSWMPDDDWFCANGERREDETD